MAGLAVGLCDAVMMHGAEYASVLLSKKPEGKARRAVIYNLKLASALQAARLVLLSANEAL